MNAPIEKVIGVLGGMGPEATVAFLSRLVAATPASIDQQHLRVITDSNPKIPDRTKALTGSGESPVPAMLASLRSLRSAGAEFAVIPCVTAHAFLPELRRESPLPIYSIVDAVAEELVRLGLNSVGLIATIGTVEIGFFQKRLAESGVETIVPTPASQKRVMQAIYDIKLDAAGHARHRPKSVLTEVAFELIGRGAGAIIAGCTEIPLALEQKDILVPYLDSLTLLARAAIAAAGKNPLIVEGTPCN
jgi:aspartate racemase